MHVEIAEGIRSILIVEDEMIVAMLMENLVRELGVQEVHLCADAASALEIVRTQPVDLAILDIKVRDGDTMEVAEALADRDILFLFSTGSDVQALEGAYATRPRINKPFLDDDFRLVVLDTWTLARSARRRDARHGQEPSAVASD